MVKTMNDEINIKFQDFQLEKMNILQVDMIVDGDRELITILR